MVSRICQKCGGVILREITVKTGNDGTIRRRCNCGFIKINIGRN